MTRRAAPKPVRFDAGDRISKDGVAGTYIKSYRPGFVEVAFDVEPSRKIVIRDHGIRIVERAEPARRRRNAQREAGAL